MTLSKIAKLANVSVSTASKAFSMSTDISEQMREHIFEVAKKHGCFKQFYNVKYPRLVIAIVCPELASLYYGSLIEEIQGELKALGCEVCISNSMFSANATDVSIGYFSDYSSVDGIISIAYGEHCDGVNVPYICANEIVQMGKKGMDEAISYLIQNGVTDIGFIGEELTLTKQSDFCVLMAEHGLSVDENKIVIIDERFAKGGYEAMKSFFDRNVLPRAVICAYDYMAMGAIRCISDMGLSVPEDIAIIGMDNIPETEYFIPSISSIDYGNFERARALAKGIVDKINGRTPTVVTVDESLVLRESSKF